MYCTLDDIKKLIPEDSLLQLTDDENLGAVDQARVEEAVAQADAEIDSYIGGRYGVPLSTVPGVVKKMSVDIAIYNLYSRRVEEMPEVRKDRYRSAVDQLKLIAKGTVSLGVAELPPAADTGGAETNKATDENVFTRDKLKGF
jgi:phage gp36-like protein